MKSKIACLCAVLGLLLAGSAATPRACAEKNVLDDRPAKAQVLAMPLDSFEGLDVETVQDGGVNVVKTKSDIVTYRGRRALRIVNIDDPTAPKTMMGAQAIAIAKTSDLGNGTIEADVAGMPREGASPSTRGFVGIAFHVQDHGARYECFYLRMTNGRSSEQVMRNRSTQYISRPDFPWNRLREEHPGVYESYVDLEPGVWTKMKIVISGTKASLYVNRAEQPTLIVNDLKLGETHGQVALWTGSDTEAYFSNLTVR
jgi:hypothetical protein